MPRNSANAWYDWQYRMMTRANTTEGDEMTYPGMELLTLEETAQALRKSPAQLRWMIHKGRAPRSALIGGRRMFRASDVNSFVEAAFAS
jgi:predicted DNA-binding transcriptional regulator AlpA